jgi:hypothetical protein
MVLGYPVTPRMRKRISVQRNVAHSKRESPHALSQCSAMPHKRVLRRWPPLGASTLSSNRCLSIFPATGGRYVGVSASTACRRCDVISRREFASPSAGISVPVAASASRRLGYRCARVYVVTLRSLTIRARVRAAKTTYRCRHARRLD